MKLTRLRLIGFKSFVEPTDFLIEPGLTGVVGPNGCGKSNLVEALRWVMGETSHKSMRAAEMDDVIFSGNNNRPPRNTAEVAIQIDNEKHEAPTQFNEHDTLDVSRRIEREKGSAYRINGREVRARDVMTLFADASTGSRSPALVHQGRIGEIIQAKPEQRRRVLEEAAGISGLHARRHEAELRLKAAETNLLRVEDVVKQLAGQIDALKRQARQAIRYRTVSAEVRKVEATLYHLRWLGANAEVQRQRAGQGSRASARSPTPPSPRAKPARAARPPPPACRRSAKPRRGPPPRCSACVIARDTLDAEETRARERLAELDRRLAQFEEDVARERTLVADAEAALAQLTQEEETLRNDVRASAERRTGVDARAAEADSVVTAAETELRRVDRRACRPHRAAQPTHRRRRASNPSASPASKARLANIEAGLAAAAESQPDLAALAAAGRSGAGRGRPGRTGGDRRRDGARQRAPQSRRRARAARRCRARGAAARHRSQDADEASGGRNRRACGRR